MVKDTETHKCEIIEILDGMYEGHTRFQTLQHLVETMYPGWRLVPTKNCEVKASHPITVANPTEYFHVDQVRFEGTETERSSAFAVIGENTCWFGLKGITPKEKED